MNIIIGKFDPSKEDLIKEASHREWNVGNNDWYSTCLTDGEEGVECCSEGVLCGGETEEEFAERLSKAVWRANGGYCVVNVVAVCLEYLPGEEYQLDEDEYNTFAKSAKLPLSANSDDDDELFANSDDNDDGL
jgi:hypothetical protein